MKKYLFLLLLPFLAVALNGCNDDDDQLDPTLIKGTWEAVGNDHFDYTAIYTFENVRDFSNYGIVEVKYLRADGTNVEEIPVRRYDWHAAGPEGNNGILDITLSPCDVSPDAPAFFYETYAITRLTSSKMVWKGLEPNSIKNKSVEFIRRSEN